MALRNILLRVTGDADDAKSELRETVEQLRDFGRETAEARADIRTEAAQIQLQRLNERLQNLGKQEATPKVKLAMGRTVEQIERIEARLAKLGARDVEVDVDVNRRGGVDGALSGIGGALGAAAGGIGSIGGAITGTAGFFARLGPVITGLAITIGAVLLPAVVALGASLLTAAAGAGALAIAFAGALGPAVLVVVAFFTRLVKIFAAVKAEQDGAADRASAVASAQEQVVAATEGLAGAQANLRQQTTAAWDAYRDSIENVKDALLAVEGAEISRDRARLNTRNAKDALADFRKELGAGGQVADLFRKFTDVDVQFDSSQLRGLTTRMPGRMTDDDERKLEGLILDVRDAKHQERLATNRLGDEQRNLSRARRTEAQFLREGIRAHDGYAAAVRQVASAQRQVVTATRGADDARRRQTEAMADLAPVERRFATSVLRFGRTLRRAFDPAVREILRGLTTLMRAMTRLLEDPQVRRALTSVGRAIGSVFRSLGRELGRGEFSRIFTDLSRGGASLIRVLGSKVFTDFLRIMLRIAAAALPELLKLVRSVARETSGWEKGTRDSDKMRGGVRRLIGSFKDWIELVRQVSRLFLGFLRIAAPEGDGLVRSLSRIVRRWADFLNTREGQERVRRFFRDLVKWSKEVADNIASLAKSLGKIAEILARLDPKLFLEGPLPKIIKGNADGGAKGGGGLLPIPILRGWFRHAGGPIGGLGDVPVLAEGGEFMLRRSVVRALGLPALTALNAGLSPAAAFGGGGGGMRIDQFHAHVQSPAGTAPDGEYTAAQLERAMRRRGRG